MLEVAAMDGSENSGDSRCLTATSVFTNASDGDFAVPPQGTAPLDAADERSLALRRSSIVDMPWTWLRQVHGGRVVVVDKPGQFAGVEADAAVTASANAVVSVQTADCAGVLFAGFAQQKQSDGKLVDQVVAVGAAHAGWRGVAAEILQTTVAELEALGAQRVIWALGPCISPAAYEFGESELQSLVDRYGESLRGYTDTGAPALDLRAAVSAALSETSALQRNAERIPCTATEPGYFSWRARRDTARQVAAIWMCAPSSSPAAGMWL
ncbi:unannotated protein [freshwater metagenome]|uniref:Unannotated protein n=1 Tax=freshwater metagenome TaxID=449393 RepID=A0A6J7HEM9_9ZZZZ|nr:hypothetical protein [Actinomycetota bacterium]